MRRLVAALIVLVAACSSDAPASDVSPPEPATAADVEALLATSELPVVLNVWASWCIPCRSEAPLLDDAAARFGDSVRFVMLNVRDNPADASEFIAEFFPDAPMEHLADQPGDIPTDLGGTRGVPQTFFYGPQGELVTIHFGVIDERTLALQIDEVLAR